MRRKAAATALIFDDELSPAQAAILNSSRAARCSDRTQLILDIFARRARTREGRLQIELAQLQYLAAAPDARCGPTFPASPVASARAARVRRNWKWTVAGCRNASPGWSAICARCASTARSSVKAACAATGRWPRSIGYTNAGKSSLLNRLTGAGCWQKTSSSPRSIPTTRQLVLPKQTEGAPHGHGRLHPQAAAHGASSPFKATLEEVQLADLLIHVVDLSHPQYHEQMAARGGNGGRNWARTANRR